MVGTPLDIALSAILGAIGVSGLTLAFGGWFLAPLQGVMRALTAVGSLLVLWPAPVLGGEPLVLGARIVGLVMLGAMLMRQRGMSRALT